MRRLKLIDLFSKWKEWLCCEFLKYDHEDIIVKVFVCLRTNGSFGENILDKVGTSDL